MELFRQYWHSCLLKYPKLYWFLVATVFGLLLFRLFWYVNSWPIELWDEQTNVDQVRNILSSNPSAFLEKPPLWYWLTSQVVRFGGDNLLTFRAVSIIGACGIFFTVFGILYRFVGKTRALLGLVFVLAINQLFEVNVVGYFASHTLWTADLESLMLLLLLTAQWTFLEAFKAKNKHWLWLSFALLGMAVLTKGPAALIPLGFELAYLWYKLVGSGAFYTRKDIVLGLLIFGLVALPWHLWMWSQYGNLFLEQYLNYHIWQRAVGTIEGHFEQWYFYWGILLDIRINMLWPILYFLIIRRLRNNKLSLLSLYSFSCGLGYFFVINLMATKLAWYLIYFQLILILI